jgi:hypothetical protein
LEDGLSVEAELHVEYSLLKNNKAKTKKIKADAAILNVTI